MVLETLLYNKYSETGSGWESGAAHTATADAIRATPLHTRFGNF